MTLVLSPATAWDLQGILRGLSAQNDAERAVLGFSMEQALAHLTGLLAKGPSEAIMDNGEVIAAFGIVKGGGFNSTWFVATPTAFTSGIRGIRISRERVKHFRSAYGKPLRSVSYSPLPEAAKWFRVLGFVEEPSVDGGRVFIYR